MAQVSSHYQFNMDDPFRLNRFVVAQQNVYANVIHELAQGHKSSHWMWFIFPQISGLGNSQNARTYAIVSLQEVRAYLAHATLGPRLRECTRSVNRLEGRSLQEIFGGIDALKFCSSMTLFSIAAPEEQCFKQALQKYCDGQTDALTLQALEKIYEE